MKRLLASLLLLCVAGTAVANDFPALYTAAGRVHLKAGELAVSGTDYVLTPAGSQPVSATLTSLAAQGAAAVADRVPYFTAANVMALSGFTAYGRSVVAAIDATAAKVLLSLTKSDVGLSLVDNTSDAGKPVSTAQQTALNLKANLAGGNTFSGNQTLGSGGKLILSGGYTSGQGNIQQGAAASAAYDTNLIYTHSNADTSGLLCSSTPSFSAANGPYLALRGNTYSAYGSQRGIMSISAGNPSVPVAGEGVITFRTGADALRLIILYNGNVGIGSGTVPSAYLHIKAGTAAAGTAPLKLTSGTNLTTPESGAFEFDGTNLYFTVGGVRKTVTLL